MSSIKTMAEFTEVLKNNPKQAYDFIAINYYKMDKAEIVAIVKELLYGIYNDCSTFEMAELLEDVAIELDEQYDEYYQECDVEESCPHCDYLNRVNIVDTQIHKNGQKIVYCKECGKQMFVCSLCNRENCDGCGTEEE